MARISDASSPPQTAVPMPPPPPPPVVGTLPTQYKRMSSSANEPTRGAPSNRLYMLIPLLICASLLYFAYSQWHQPAPVELKRLRVDKTGEKKRVWWMPDLLKTLPPFADGYRLEKFVEKYNLTSCNINGNFPEINSAILCYLYDSELFSNANKSISEDLQGTGLCGGAPPLTLESWDQWKKLITKPARRIAIVQEPLERFARQFRRICQIEKQCFDCGANIACFIRKILREHRKLAEGLQGHIRTYLTNNFSPQTWNCHFNREFHNIQPIKLGGNETEKLQFTEQLNVVLAEQGVAPELRETIKAEVMKIPLKLSKEELKIMETVRKDEDLWRLFRYLYEHDYTVFGYKL